MVSRRASLLFSFVALTSACASPNAAESVAAETADISTGTKVFLVPMDDVTRRVCGETLDQYYCTTDAAANAAAACVAKARAAGVALDCDDLSCFSAEVAHETCTESGPVYPDAASCAEPRPRTCNFYKACLESSTPCGDTGYALGYGERFCYSFKHSNLSARGEAWRDGVMECLQKELVPYLGTNATCSEIESHAFGSHAGCYTSTTPSLCFLPPSDLVAIFSTIGAKELLKWRTIDQGRQVVSDCLAQIALAPFRPRLWHGGSAGQDPMEPSDMDDLRSPRTLDDAELQELSDFWHNQEREFAK